MSKKRSRSLQAASCIAATAVLAAVLTACAGSDGPGAEAAAASGGSLGVKSASSVTPIALSLSKIGGFVHAGGAGSSEIVEYDPSSRRLFVVNGQLGTVDVLDLSDPTTPIQVGAIDVKRMFGDQYAAANSVAVTRGVVAIAIEHQDKTEAGLVGFVRARDLERLGAAAVGALPDMLTFTPNGKYLLVANEGEPNGYGAGRANGTERIPIPAPKSTAYWCGSVGSARHFSSASPSSKAASMPPAAHA